MVIVEGKIVIAELIMPFGIGFVIGIVLFVVLERAGCIDKWLVLESFRPAEKDVPCNFLPHRNKPIHTAR